MKNDAYVKSPFYMDLGITNYYKIVIAKGITNIPKLSDFLQVCQEWKWKIENHELIPPQYHLSELRGPVSGIFISFQQAECTE